MLNRITTQNRGIARKLLSAWHPSKLVRVMSLHTLHGTLLRAIKGGLITEEQTNRALSNTDQSAPPPTSGAGAQSEESEGEGAGSESEDESGESESDSRDSEDEDEDDNEDEAKDESEDEDEGGGEDEKKDEDEDEYKTDEDEDIRHEMLDTIKAYIKADIPVMLVGPTGCGKSYLAEQVAKELELDYYCTGSVFAKYDLIGYVNQVTDKYHGTPAFDAHTKGGLYCQDEMDASNAAALVAFNALNDKQTTFAWPCGVRTKHATYRAIGTANTWGNGATADYVGRNKLDGATVNRYVRVYVDYDKRVERRIGSKDICQRIWSIREACAELGIRHILSTRSVDYAERAKAAGLTRTDIDRDILFAGLDEDTVRQIKTSMRSAS